MKYALPLTLLAAVLTGCSSSTPRPAAACQADALVISQEASERVDRIADARDLAWVGIVRGEEPAVAVRFCADAAQAIRDGGPRTLVRVDGVRAVLDSQSLLDADGEAEIVQPDSRSARDLAARLSQCVATCPPPMPQQAPDEVASP